jgi:hypothetical protein
MSAPTHPSRPQHAPHVRPVDTPSDVRTVWIAPTPPSLGPGHPAVAKKLVLPPHTPLGTAVDVVARLGTAITLAALLVVTATVLGVVDGDPMPMGATTTAP